MSATDPLVPYRITICGLDELRDHAPAGVSHVVSILDPHWPDPGEFRTYPPHRRVLWRFDDVVRDGEDVVAPGEDHVADILALGETLEADGAHHVLIHCHAGISRSTATAVILMVRDNPGREADAFAHIAEIRPRAWPNARMLAFADARLERGGALLDALRDHQRRIARDYPEFAALLKGTDRAHELLGLGV